MSLDRVRGCNSSADVRPESSLQVPPRGIERPNLAKGSESVYTHPMARLYDNITEMVGNTPLVRLQRIAQHLDARLYAKLEFFNPLSSV